MKNDRTPHEILLAYYLSKFWDDAKPPELVKLGVTSQTDLIRSFFRKLGNLAPYIKIERIEKRFIGVTCSLRDKAFANPHSPANVYGKTYGPIIAPWIHKSSVHVWQELQQYSEITPAQSISRQGSKELSPIEAHDDQSIYTYSSEDLRTKSLREIADRRGQAKFRETLQTRYFNQCQLTGSKCSEVLEAAHIDQHSGTQTNHPGNGLLLRSDIHTLFDLNLIGIVPRSLRIVLHSSIAEHYSQIVLPKLYTNEVFRPLIEPLQRRYKLFLKNE